jgi:hypothetical protein
MSYDQILGLLAVFAFKLRVLIFFLLYAPLPSATLEYSKAADGDDASVETKIIQSNPPCVTPFIHKR